MAQRDDTVIVNAIVRQALASAQDGCLSQQKVAGGYFCIFMEANYEAL
jgi:hypothetical protein